MESGKLLTLCLMIVALIIPKRIDRFGESPSKTKRVIYRIIQVLAIVVAILMSALIGILIERLTGYGQY